MALEIIVELAKSTLALCFDFGAHGFTSFFQSRDWGYHRKRSVGMAHAQRGMSYAENAGLNFSASTARR